MQKSGIIIIICCLLASSLQAQITGKSLQTEQINLTLGDSLQISALSGSLTVPENRQRADSRSIQLDFVVLRSLSAKAANTPPLLYLAGGPGNPCTWQAQDPDYLADWVPYLAHRDVILLDQRGTTDELLNWYWDGPFPTDFFRSAQVAGQHWRHMAGRALQAYQERGVDINGYSTAESIGDIEALREALGYEKLSLLGFSYGTHLGLAYMQHYAARTDRAVLAGIEGPDHTMKDPRLLDIHLARISTLVAQDPLVGQEMPDMIGRLNRLLYKLEEEPVEVTVYDLITGEPMTLPVGGFGLKLIIRLDAGDANDLPVLPRLIYSLEQGDVSLLQWFVQKRIALAYGVPGMSIMMDMAAGASPARTAYIEAVEAQSVYADVVNFPFREIGNDWPHTAQQLDPAAVVHNQIPTLLLSGEFDANTPPVHAEEIKWGLGNATHLVVAGAGHEQILSSQEVIDSIQQFLQGESVTDVRANYGLLRFIPLSGMHDELWHPSIEE